MKKTRIEVVAAEAIPFGSRVRIDRHDPKNPVCRRSVKNSTMDGVAIRRWGERVKTWWEPGDLVVIETEGHIMVEGKDGTGEYLELRRGQIVE